MNEKTVIDIRKSASNAINETVLDLSGFLIVAMFIGIAFAPWFSPFIRNHLEHKYDVNNNIRHMDIVNEQMVKVNVILWVAAIIAWAIIFISAAIYHA